MSPLSSLSSLSALAHERRSGLREPLKATKKFGVSRGRPVCPPLLHLQHPSLRNWPFAISNHVHKVYLPLNFCLRGLAAGVSWRIRFAPRVWRAEDQLHC